jgi:CheY-like chemotaxis protein
LETALPENRSILLVEDNPGDVFLIEKALRPLNLPLQTADDGYSAIQLLDDIDADQASPAPAIMLLDVNLPRGSGHDVLRRVRSSPKCGKIPVVIVTSSDWPDEKVDLFRAGATHYFRKPMEFASFMQLGDFVRRILDGGEPPSPHEP